MILRFSTFVSISIFGLSIFWSCKSSKQKVSPGNAAKFEKTGSDSILVSKQILSDQGTRIQCGADRTEMYFPQLKGKRVGLVINPTSRVGNIPLVDTLRSIGVEIIRIFGPEHGFRGRVGAGIKVANETDSATSIPIVSLYGKSLKPKPEQLNDLDLLVFDIQDVGARFYTYNQTLHYVMEACAEAGKTLLILDRPNPNGVCVDGPILEPELKSFIGMHPIPICHGLTVGEYAKMLNGEGWLKNMVQCDIQIIPVKNYRHDSTYILPVSPSPNLNSELAIRLYPSLCLFEGTRISLGRGTLFPFTVLGSPDLKDRFLFSFQPTSIKGMAENPLYKDQICYGLDLRNMPKENFPSTHIQINWLLEMYQAFPDKSLFFDKSISNQIGDFNKLAGTRMLRHQIETGLSESEIRKSWEPGLSQFRSMRIKYLIYP